MNRIVASTLELTTARPRRLAWPWRRTLRLALIAVAVLAAYLFVLNFFDICYWLSTPLVGLVP